MSALSAFLRALARPLLLGRRLRRSIDRNAAAADRLDALLREVIDQ